MKKTAVITFLLFAFILTLCSCGDKDEASGNSSTEGSSVQTLHESSESITEESPEESSFKEISGESSEESAESDNASVIENDLSTPQEESADEDSETPEEDSSAEAPSAESAEEASEPVIESSGEIGEEASGETSQETSEPGEIITQTKEEFMGETAPGAAFKADITAEYSGGEVIVTVSVKDVSAPDGLQTIDLTLHYDNARLELANPTSDGSAAYFAFQGFAEWEELTTTSRLDDGTPVIKLYAGTVGGASGNHFTYAKNNGELKFNIRFKVKEGAASDIPVWIPHKEASSVYIDEVTFETVDYTGYGDFILINPSSPEPEEEEYGETIPEESSEVSSEDSAEESSEPISPESDEPKYEEQSEIVYDPW